MFPEPQFYIFLPFFCISAGTRTERARSMPCALSAAALESPFPVLLKSILSGSMPLLMYLPAGFWSGARILYPIPAFLS